MTIKSNATDNKSCWWIPLTMTTSLENDFNQTKPKSWLNCKNETKTISLGKDNEWVIFNLQLAGKLYNISPYFLIFPLIFDVLVFLPT